MVRSRILTIRYNIVTLNGKCFSIFMVAILFGAISVSSQTTGEYYSDKLDSAAASAELPKYCQSYSKRCAKKCERLARSLRNLTDRYLSAFEDLEDAVILSYCTINERKAESLLKYAGYSKRRFLSQSTDTNGQQASKSDPALDTMEMALDSFHKMNSNCGHSDARSAIQLLKQEIHRNQVASKYMNERISYLKDATQGSPLSWSGIGRMEKLHFYYAGKTSELRNIFQDQSIIERIVLGLINKLTGVAIDPSALAVGTGSAPTLSADNINTASSGAGVASVVDKKGISQIDGLRQTTKEKVIRFADFSKQMKVKSDSIKSLIQQGDSLGIGHQLKDSLELIDNRNVEQKCNPLRNKRWRDRVVPSGNFQFDTRTSILPQSATFSGQLLFQLTRRWEFGVGFGGNIAIVRTAPKERGVLDRTWKWSGEHYRTIVCFRLKGMLFLQSGLELHAVQLTETTGQAQSLRSNLVGAGGEALFFSVPCGLKIKYPGKTNKTMEILYDPFAGGGRNAFVVRMGFEFPSKHSYKPI